MYHLRKRIYSKEQRRNASEDMLIGVQEDPDQGAQQEKLREKD